MSDAEKRQLRAMALLEVEEATEHLNLLRVKQARWADLVQQVHYLLVRGRRDSATMEGNATEQRLKVDKLAGPIGEVLDLSKVLELDDEVQQAVDRLTAALRQKNLLGLGRA